MDWRDGYPIALGCFLASGGIYLIVMIADSIDSFPVRPRIGVIGSGAMGCYYGARLAQHGHDVRFLMRGDLAVVRQAGLKVKSCAGDFELPQVQAFGTTAEMGPCDLVLIAIKTTANADLASLLPPLLHEGTVIVTLQNGLGNEAHLASLHRADQVLGGVCFVCINRLGPGLIDHISDGDVALGEFEGGPRPRTEAISALLNACGIPSPVEPSLAVVRWKKLVWNIPFNGLAITGGGITTADILADPALAADARVLAEEAVSAAAALGHVLPEGWADYQLSRTPAMGPYRPSSMIDYVEGRPVEVEAIWGEPVRQAVAAGAVAPRMAALYQEILTAVAQRKS
jgi:2-dehydropantoate 2-reductase